MIDELPPIELKMRSRQETGFLNRTTQVGTENYNYQIYVSPQAAKMKNPPVIIFLHGIRERGTNGVSEALGPYRPLLEQYLSRIPAIIILPQCRPGKFWQDRTMDKMVMQALAEASTEYAADESRVSLLGISMGGFGTWHFASSYPEKFAGVVSICGGSPVLAKDRFTPLAAKTKNIPAWLFHGSADEVVPVTESREIAKALETAGGRVKYTEYPNAGHNAWLKALSDKELLPWLLAQRRVDTKQ